MFGLGPMEIVFGLVPLLIGIALAIWIIRIAVAPLDQKLDRIIELLKDESRRHG
jgi:hypothetical protein